jgi:hypothetical protein
MLWIDGSPLNSDDELWWDPLVKCGRQREVWGLGGVAEDQAWFGGSPGAFICRGKVGLVALLPATSGMLRWCGYKLQARISLPSLPVDVMDRDDELWFNIVTTVVVKASWRCGLAVAVSGMRGSRRSSSSPRPWSGMGQAGLQMSCQAGPG